MRKTIISDYNKDQIFKDVGNAKKTMLKMLAEVNDEMRPKLLDLDRRIGLVVDRLGVACSCDVSGYTKAQRNQLRMEMIDLEEKLQKLVKEINKTSLQSTLL